MNCKRAQAQIALSVGGDLDDAAERELREHVAGCPGCRRHWKQMDETWSLLLDREDELPDPHDSVWPDLQVRLPDRRELLSRARFNGGVVALAALGVCLAVVSLWKTANTSEPMLEPSGFAENPPGLPGEPGLSPRRGLPATHSVGDSLLPPELRTPQFQERFSAPDPRTLPPRGQRRPVDFYLFGH